MSKAHRNTPGLHLRQDCHSSHLVYYRVLTWIGIALSGSLVLLGNLRFGSNVLAASFEDDFFYYAQVARNLVLHGRSTFDGVHLTNGYHPLWLFILTVLTKLVVLHSSSNAVDFVPLAFLLGMTLLCLLLISSWFSYHVFRLYASELLSLSLQMFVASFTLVLLRTGMEVGLTLVFGWGLLWFRLRPTFSFTLLSCAAYGLLASFMVLSRLDAILLVVMILAFDLLRGSLTLTERLLRGISFLFGMFPLALYLMSNEYFFKTLTPVSGMAKQLRSHHSPSIRALHSFLSYFVAPSSPTLILFFFFAFLGLWLVARDWHRLEASRGVVLAALLFAPVQLFVIVTLSDWQLWRWYLYPWVISGSLGAAIYIHNRQSLWISARLSSIVFATSLLFLVGFAGVIACLSNPAHNQIYTRALEFRAFARSHPGVYAMGDRSGAPGFLMGVPVLQLEGLMMDRDYLTNIRAQRNLLDVLAFYHVNYYVSSGAKPDASGCYEFTEPKQAGPDSPAMHARVCQHPLAEYGQGTFVNDIFSVSTMRSGEQHIH